MKTSKRILALVLILSLSLFAVVGCKREAPPAETPQTPQTPSVETPAPEQNPADRSVTVTDMSGDKVTINGEVKRIVNLWPAGTSSFFVMGAGDLVVGLAVNNPGTMNEWTKLLYPNCVEIPAMGGTTPTIEEIANLKPDLVIIHPSNAKEGYAEKIRAIGIPAINIDFGTYDTMVQAYTMLGEALGGEYQEKLAGWCSEVQTKLAKVREITANIPEAERPVVYYVGGQTDSLTTTMPATSIIADWVESAGGVYAARSLEVTSAEVTPEAVFALNPDIVVIGGVYQHVEEKAITTTDGWKDLKAVKDGRIYKNPYGCFNWDRFGLESLMQINYALMCIQPELAAENGIDRDAMVQEIIDFYKTYTNFELTKVQAENMLNGLSPDGQMQIPVQ